MSKESLSVEEWSELYGSLVNSVGRDRMESILTHFIMDNDNHYNDIDDIIDSMGLKEDREAFRLSVEKACSRLSDDELASLTFDAIAMIGRLDESKTIHVGEHSINPDMEKLRHTLMLLDVQVTGNNPAFVRDWHKDFKYEVNPLKFLKGESQTICLSEDDDQSSILLDFSKSGCKLICSQDSLLPEQMEVFEAISGELLKQIEKIAEVNRQAAIDRNRSNLSMDI